MNNKINTFPYLWIENPAIDYILRNYLPTLKTKVEEILKVKSCFTKWDFLRDDLPKNSNILSLKALGEIRELMISNLNEMCEILDWKKPIVFIADSCFTNQLLIKQLFNILFEDFDRFVDIVEIDYENPLNNLHLKDKIYNNSIIILWGSFSDTYTIPDSMYSWPLFDLIKELSKDTVWIEINNKILWVCFWQQYINNIMWIDRIFSERIMTTIKWVSQFWLMPFEFDKNVKNVENIHYMYRWIVNALSNYGKNKWFTWVLTRTWHVDFNLLNSFTVNSSSYVPIVNDTITWSPIIWGTKNWNILWNQAHLEVNLFEDLKILEDESEKLIPFLEDNYWKNVSNILTNINSKHWVNNSMWDIFYISSLNELSFWIVKKYQAFEREKNKKNEYTYFPKNVCEKFDDVLLDWVSEFNFKTKVKNSKYIQNLDYQWKLKMLTTLDWKVSRWLNEIWKTIWLWNMRWFIEGHKAFIESLPTCYHWDSAILNWSNSDINTNDKIPYVFRDFWAWNWELVKEVDAIDWVYSYWIWDYAYFDIYEWIKNHKAFNDIPVNIIKILVQELFEHFDEDTEKSYPILIKRAIKKVTFKIKTISDSSMFSDKTDMFNDTDKTLNLEDQDFINKNPERLNEIKDYIMNNFYELIEWYFEKLMVSDFDSLNIRNKYIKQSDFQTAIRSTSHIDWWTLTKTLIEYVKYYSKPWSIYFDNWVVRSYSSVPRIKEYIDLEEKFKNIKIYFTYDISSNYISSAVILKEPYVNTDLIKKHLDKNIILLKSNDLYSNSFFRIERFYRELIILCFKNYKVFYNKNKEIMNFLKFLSLEIKTMNNSDIKKIILIWINNLIYSVNKDFWEKYSKLTIKDLNFYISKTDPTVRDILGWNINIQDWFNTDFNRNN